MSGEEAIALNDIAFKIRDDAKVDSSDESPSLKDERIKDLEQTLNHKTNVRDFIFIMFLFYERITVTQIRPSVRP